MQVVAKNWGDFQHYKDRDPSWIKLHKKLLDDFEYQSLPVASRALAPMLWLLCSESKDGSIETSEQKLSFRLRMSVGELTDALMPLVQADFFIVVHDASEPLAECKRDAMPEKENKEQVQAEKEGQGETDAAFADALSAYNLIARENNWPEAGMLNRTRRSKLSARFRECGGISGWRAAMAKARASPWLRGDVVRGKGFEGWTPDLDFFLQQSSFTKLMEGKYDQRIGAKTSGFDALREGARRAAGLDGGLGQGVDSGPDNLVRLALPDGGRTNTPGATGTG